MSTAFRLRFASATFVAAFSVLLAGCGGGGGGSGDTSGGIVTPAGTTAPPITGAPTATIAASQQAAGDAVTAAKNGAVALDKVDGFSSLPLGVRLQSAPLAVTTTQTTPCSGGGTELATINQADLSTTTAGDSAHLVLSGCVELAMTFNGTIDISVSRWASDSNFAFNFAATNFTVSQGSLQRGPFSFSGAFDVVNSTVSYSFSVDGQSVIGAPSISRSGTVMTVGSATVRAFFGGGFAELTYADWRVDTGTGRPSSGSVRVVGANGNSMTISVASDGYHVTVTVGGVGTSYVVAF